MIGEHFKEVGQARLYLPKGERSSERRIDKERGEKGKLKEIQRLRFAVPWFLRRFYTYTNLGPVQPVSFGDAGGAPHEPWIKVRLATSVKPLNFVFCLSTRPNRRIGSCWCRSTGMR